MTNSTGTIVEYSRADLAKASPASTLTLSNVGGILSFDPSGDLWVSNGSTSVAEFTKSQLTRSGTPKPNATLGDSGCTLAIDASGDVWVGTASGLSEFTEAEITKSGSPAPKVTITTTSLSNSCKPAFDRSGDLWAADYGGSTVLEFTKAQLAKSGSPTPARTIKGAATGLNNPSYLVIEP